MSELLLYNTLNRKKEPLEPIKKGKVGIYTCGPTVYQYATIGNFRSYIFSDILRRVLEYEGYSVKHVMNITDVGHLVSDADEGEDKMVTGARKMKKTPEEIAEMYTKDFFESMDKLNILRPTIACKATEHISDMIEMIQRLEENGYTYRISDGVYYDVMKFKGYGKLSGLRLEDQRAGARVDVNPEKKHPADFALWKIAEPGHIMKWNSPWGVGYPGWHIECSAMSIKYLGEHFDIHTGGVDHIPVHHENEIAQNQGTYGHQVVNKWMHGEFLQVDGGKMSKSLNNFYRLPDLEEKGFTGLDYRYFCLTGHYRSQLNFTWDSLAAAANAHRKLATIAAELRELENGKDTEPCSEKTIGSLRREFVDAIRDDLNMPKALAVVWKLAKTSKSGCTGLYPLLLDYDRVLGLRLAEAESKSSEVQSEDEIPEHVKTMMKERNDARSRKDWEQADKLRKKIEDAGYMIRDSADGPILVRRER